MERFSLSKGAQTDKAAANRQKGIDQQLKHLKNEQQVNECHALGALISERMLLNVTFELQLACCRSKPGVAAW